LRFLVLISFLFIKLGLLAQESLALPDFVLPITKGYERDPVKLVNKLTEGKTGDKEKFDVIFTWVAKNIRYDYNSYLSSSGASMPKIKRILKYKKGICIDYAYLMDTLCTLAGIKNVSVYGYAKDDLFDVNDSIFMDNHAWNAVKLDNYWYVYDVTWSSGLYKWRYKKFSKRIVDLKRKIVSKGKEKTITFKITKTTECDTIKKSYNRTFISLSLKQKFILKLLSIFKIKKRHYFDKADRLDFYLTNPEVFAITHFPDNPYWSLTANYKTLKDFESDSAFYHLNDSVYIKQKRESRFCKECDNYFSLDEMNKQKEIKNNGFNFNKRNRFITWLSNYNIGNIFYEKSLLETDSLAKVSMIDSSITHFLEGKDDLHQSIVYVGKESEFQRTKNGRKAQILYGENKKHINFIHAIIASTYKETVKMARFTQKANVTVRKLRIKKKKLQDIGDKIKIKSHDFRTRENILEIQVKLKEDKEQIEFLNSGISSLVNKYSATVSLLSDNLWKKIKLQDSLASPFISGEFYRWLYLLDNYKKIIVEKRKRIKKYEDLYASNLKDSIFNVSDSFADSGFQVFDLFEKRNILFVESAKLTKILVNEKIVDPKNFKKFIDINSDRIQENICWIIGGSSKLQSVITGYKMLLMRQKEIEKIIRNENRTEYARQIAINREIVRRKRKFKHIPFHNLRVTSRRKNFVQKYRREYLKKLKEDRKKAKK
jgi:hypothetical protein